MVARLGAPFTPLAGLTPLQEAVVRGLFAILNLEPTATTHTPDIANEVRRTRPGTSDEEVRRELLALQKRGFVDDDRQIKGWPAFGKITDWVLPLAVFVYLFHEHDHDTPKGNSP